MVVAIGSIWLLRTNIYPYLSTDFQSLTAMLTSNCFHSLKLITHI